MVCCGVVNETGYVAVRKPPGMTGTGGVVPDPPIESDMKKLKSQNGVFHTFDINTTICACNYMTNEAFVLPEFLI